MSGTVHSFSVPLKKYYSADLLALFYWAGPKAEGRGVGWGGQDRGGRRWRQPSELPVASFQSSLFAAANLSIFSSDNT